MIKVTTRCLKGKDIHGGPSLGSCKYMIVLLLCIMCLQRFSLLIYLRRYRLELGICCISPNSMFLSQLEFEDGCQMYKFSHCIRGFVYIYPYLYLYIFEPSTLIMSTNSIHNTHHGQWLFFLFCLITIYFTTCCWQQCFLNLPSTWLDTSHSGSLSLQSKVLI